MADDAEWKLILALEILATELRRQGMSKSRVREILNLSDSGFAHGDYWPLTIVPQASRPKRSKPWIMTIGALIALSAAITFAFRHGIPAW